MEKQLKKKYRNIKMSNGKITKPFYTSDITSEQMDFYCKMGFDFIFEVVKLKKKND